MTNERHAEHDRGQGRGLGLVAALDEAEDAHRDHLGLVGQLPLSSTSEPYSEMARANDRAAPAAIAGTSEGRTIRRRIVSRPAPSEAAASSTSPSSSASTGCTVRTMNGRVTKARASVTELRVLATLMPSGLCGP